MDINDLLAVQVKLVQDHQKRFQKVVKDTIKKHGTSGIKSRKEMTKGIRDMAKDTVRQDLNLGIKWLDEQ